MKTVSFQTNTFVPTRIRISKTIHTGSIAEYDARLNIDNITFLDNSDNGGLPNPDTNYEHLTLGMPDESYAVTSKTYNYLIMKDEFALSYNSDRGIPNWVAWHLVPSWYSGNQEDSGFHNDPDLTGTGLSIISTSDYTGPGFDRGHQCPNADRITNDPANNHETYVMTNIIPQAPSVNGGLWAQLEAYCRDLADAGNELYIYSGGYGNGGSGNNPGIVYWLNEGIFNSAVAVPSHLWKVIVVLPDGDDDLTRVDATTRVIAVIVPNTNASAGQPWGDYRVSVNDIEAATGYNFLYEVPHSVQVTLESQVDSGPTN